MNSALLIWPDDAERVCELIGSSPAPLKFVTKVRDDAFFLRRWIDHHAAIAGIDNLVIFDNMSVEPDILSVYEEMGENLTVVRFSGFHNMIHRVHAFPGLYTALRRSARYYQILDVDEYLIHVDTDMTYSRDRVRPVLAQCNHPVIPGIWLQNEFGYDDRFIFEQHADGVRLDIRAGKPLFHQSTEVHGMINHNFQVNPDLYGSLCTGFFVLHLKHFSPEQRIRANVAKLRQYNVLGLEDNANDALAIDPDSVSSRNARVWLKEIRRMRKTDKHPCDKEPLTEGRIALKARGRIEFASEWQAKALREILNLSGHEIISMI